MGNELQNKPVLNKKSTGFHSYDYYDTVHTLFESVEKEVATEYKEDRLSFIPSSNKINNISQIFRYIKQLGSGASCRVLKAKHIVNEKVYAVKELRRKAPRNTKLFSEEVKLLKKLMHPNIVIYYDCYIDLSCYYIATEYCSGGTMLETITRMKSFSEQKASHYIHIILSAINYIHSLNIVHRDLKAQNMVFDCVDGVLQIIDFGDAKIVDDKQIYTQFVGTIHYIAPEIIRPRTGAELKKSDLWSIGIIAYILVCGGPPFNGTTQKQILNHIIDPKKKLLYPQPIHLTKSCKHFIQRLLCDNPLNRMSASDALQHPWISGGCASTNDLSNEVLKSLKRYHYNNKLQNILVNAVLSEMDLEDQEILSDGIVEMNRDVSTLDSNAVVDYLLLYSSITEVPLLDPHWKQKRISEVKLFQKTKVFIPSKVSDNADLYKDLDTLDVEAILNEVEQREEKELQDIEENDELKLPSIENMSKRATTQDIQDRKISVDRFRSIMAKSPKEYDVEAIVDELNDGTGYIPLNKIANYSKTIKTKRDLFE